MSIYDTAWEILGEGENDHYFFNGSTSEAVSDAITVTEAVAKHGITTYRQYRQHIGDPLP